MVAFTPWHLSAGLLYLPRKLRAREKEHGLHATCSFLVIFLVPFFLFSFSFSFLSFLSSLLLSFPSLQAIWKTLGRSLNLSFSLLRNPSLLKFLRHINKSVKSAVLKRVSSSAARRPTIINTYLEVLNLDK